MCSPHQLNFVARLLLAAQKMARPRSLLRSSQMLGFSVISINSIELSSQSAPRHFAVLQAPDLAWSAQNHYPPYAFHPSSLAL
jgi:hypothetical protein